MLEDQILTCKDCGKKFTWTKEEQDYFTEKGFKNIPQRCLDCRKNARDKRESNIPKFEITCSECEKKSTVPFEPIENQPIYCQDCFDKKRST